MPQQVGDGFYFTADVNGGDSDWRLVFLDCFQIATIGYEEEDARQDEAREVFRANNPKALQTGVDWFTDVPIEKHRYCAFNGGLGKTQIAWLRTTLQTAREDKKAVIIFTHVPIYEPASSPKTIIFESEEVLEIFSEYKDVVRIVFAGHDHDGGFAMDPAGIPHATLVSPMMVAREPGVDCCAIVTLNSSSSEKKATAKITFYGNALPKGAWDERTQEKLSGEFLASGEFLREFQF